MPNIYYLKQNLIWHVIQTEKYKLNTYSFVEMRRINIWMMGVNISWVTWGLEQSLETAVRTHVASLLLNAKHLESEWRFQPSGSGEDKFGDILLTSIQPNSCMLCGPELWRYLLSTEYFTRTFCIHLPDIMYNEFIIYFLKNRSF